MPLCVIGPCLRLPLIVTVVPAQGGPMALSWQTERDSSLLAQIADGDVTALGAAMDAYGDVVYALVQQIVGPSSEAEELMHDLFLHLWRQAPRWGNAPPYNLRTWLVLEGRKRALALLQDEACLGAFGEDPRLLSPAWRPRGRYDLSAIDDPALGRMRGKMRRAIAALRPTTRTLLTLSFLRGLTPKALGQQTQQSTRRAQSRLLGAMQTIREALHSHAPGH